MTVRARTDSVRAIPNTYTQTDRHTDRQRERHRHTGRERDRQTAVTARLPARIP